MRTMQRSYYDGTPFDGVDEEHCPECGALILDAAGALMDACAVCGERFVDDDPEPAPEPTDTEAGCPMCHGSGEIVSREPYGSEAWTCPACAGSGR